MTSGATSPVGWQATTPSANGLRAGDEGEIVHLMTLDGRCMAGIAIEIYQDGSIIADAHPAAGMVVPNPAFLWQHDGDPRTSGGTGYHRRGECPRRRP